MTRATPTARRPRLIAAVATAAACALGTMVGCTEHMAANVPPTDLFVANTVDTRDVRDTIPFTMVSGVPVVTIRYGDPLVTAVLATGQPAGRFPAAAGPLIGLSPVDESCGPVYLPPPVARCAQSRG